MTYEDKRKRFLLMQSSLMLIGILVMRISKAYFLVSDILFIMAYLCIILPSYYVGAKQKKLGLTTLETEIKYYREHILQKIYRMIFVIASVPALGNVLNVLSALSRDEALADVKQRLDNLPFYIGIIMLALLFSFIFRGAMMQEGLVLAQDCFCWESIESYYCVKNNSFKGEAIYLLYLKVKKKRGNKIVLKVRRVTIGEEEKQAIMEKLKHHKIQGITK